MNANEKALAEAAFVADDLRLFLDTHPTSAPARQDYRTAANTVEIQKSRLDHAVSALDAGGDLRWDWVDTPWPWEKED